MKNLVATQVVRFAKRRKDYFCVAANILNHRLTSPNHSIGRGGDGWSGLEALAPDQRQVPKYRVRCGGPATALARAVGLKHIVCSQPNRNIKAVGCNGANDVTVVRTMFINLSNFLARSEEAGTVEGDHHLPPKHDAKRDERASTCQAARGEEAKGRPSHGDITSFLRLHQRQHEQFVPKPQVTNVVCMRLERW